MLPVPLPWEGVLLDPSPCGELLLSPPWRGL